MIWPLRLMFAGSMVTLAIVVTALSGGRLEGATGYDGAARAVILSDWWKLWAIPPVEFALIVLLALTLRSSIRRAEQRRRRRHAFFATTGLVTLLAAVVSPLGGLAQGGMFAAHMTQHVLVGAVAPLAGVACAAPGHSRLHHVASGARGDAAASSCRLPDLDGRHPRVAVSRGPPPSLSAPGGVDGATALVLCLRNRVVGADHRAADAAAPVVRNGSKVPLHGRHVVRRPDARERLLVRGVSVLPVTHRSRHRGASARCRTRPTRRP